MSEELQTRQLTGYVRDLILDRLDKAGTAVQPSHPGMSDAREPTAHTHPVAQLDDATEDGRALMLLTLAQQKARLGVNRTPFDAGALGASASLPIDTYLSIEATVPGDTTVTLPAGTLGDLSTVLLTSTASEAVTVTLPTLNWISPLGQVWDGSIAPGQSVRLWFVRSSLGWECVDAVSSADSALSLRGDLNVNDRKIVSATNGNVEIEPDHHTIVHRLRAAGAVRTVLGATHTVIQSDDGATLYSAAASAVAVAVTAGLAIDTHWVSWQAGDGLHTYTAGAGETINGAATWTSQGKGRLAYFCKTSATNYEVAS